MWRSFSLHNVPYGRKEVKMKKVCRASFSVFLAIVVLCMGIMPVFAMGDGASTYLTNCSDAVMSFGVSDGVASFYVSYTGREETFTHAKLTVQIQKKFLGLFWRDVADEWVGYCTELYGDFYDDIPVDGHGTYRAVFTLDVHGNTGRVDVMEDTIEYMY